MKIGLQDIAEKLNLSVSTVSRSLSSHPSVNPETRAQVLELASKLGYRGPKGKSVRREKQTSGTHSATVLIQSDSRFEIGQHNWQSHLLEGMSETAFELGLTLNIYYVPLEDRTLIGDVKYQPPAMRYGNVEGLILVHHYPADVVEKLSKQFPCVAVNNTCLGNLMDYIGVNNGFGIEKIVSYLHSQGHRRIGFVTGFSETSWLHDRFAGYVQAISRLGLQYDPQLVLPISIDGEREKQVDVIADKTRDGVTAWVCGNDVIGYEVLGELESRGIKAPEDVSIVGFDNIPVPNGHPKLTSIRIPIHEIGAEAVKKILARINNPACCATQVLLEPEIEVGETTKPVS